MKLQITYLTLRSNISKIKSKYIGVDLRELRLISEYTNASTLAELAVLVVEILNTREISNKRVVVSGTDQTTWKDDAVKRNVIFGHELIVVDGLGRLEPFLPIGRIIRCYGEVTDRSVEPHVEDFVLEAVSWHWSSPFEIACDTTRLETFFNPCACDHFRRIRPVAAI